MNSVRIVLVPLCLAIGLAGPAALRGDASNRAADEAVLRAAGVAPDGAALLEYLRRRVPSAADQERLAELIRQLDSNAFLTREQAAAELTAAGPKALAVLRRAAAESGLEVRLRAESCIEKIEQGLNADATAAAVRLLRERQPEGAAALLLDFLPQVREDDPLEFEVLLAVLALGVRDGKPAAMFAGCLRDPMPARRAAAALVLGRHGSAPERTQVRGLLADADRRVRLRAAQGLLAGQDKAAVPALLALVSEAPPPVAEQAVELLARLAGRDAPATPPGDTDAERRQCRAAWEAWWQTAEARLDLAGADVDLIPRDWSRGARHLAEKYLKTIEKGGQRAAFIGYPFCLLGRTVNEEKPIAEFMMALGVGVRLGGMSFSVDRVVDLDEYDAKKSDAGADQFVTGLAKKEVRAVYVRTRIGANADERFAYVLLVRFAAGKLKVIGFIRQVGNTG